MVTFKPQPPKENIDIWNTRLPIEATWGIYARQSTPAQLINNTESTEMQTEDLNQWLLTRGVAEERILLFDADLGVSGTLRIDQRTGLQELVGYIEADEIKAVLVYLVSRLFRDQTGVQYNTFANICKEHNCILITADGMIFNFNNPMHLKMFRYLAEMAAEFIPQQIHYLNAAQLRKARKGYYAGWGVVPSGYIVDYCKDNKTYQKLIVYLPHAKKVIWIFKRFFELGGNIMQLRREVLDMPYVFPAFGSEVDQRNITHWKRRLLPGGGYSLSRSGLEKLLTNPVYIGWWIVQGDVISRNNHERVLDEEEEYLFWYAFERLAPYTTEGKLNTNREIQPKRYFQKDTKPPQFGELKERLIPVSPYTKVFTHLTHGTQHYCIVPPARTSYSHTGYMEMEAHLIDRAFEDLFFDHLRQSRDFEVYKRWIASETQKQQQQLANLTHQLNQIAIQQQAAMKEILDTQTRIIAQAQSEEERKQLEQETEPLLNMWREELTNYLSLKQELSQKKEHLQQSQELRQAEQYADFQTELAKLIPIWHTKPLRLRIEFVNLFVKEAILEVVATHFVRLTVYWSYPMWEPDTSYIRRKRGVLPYWTEEERDTIKQYYPTSKRQRLLQLLPHKSWDAIRTEASNLGTRRNLFEKCEIPHNLTWADWQFMQAQAIQTEVSNTNVVTRSHSKRATSY